jgi:hypothetical protein
MRGTPDLAVCHCSEGFLITRNFSLRSRTFVSNIKNEQMERAGLESEGFNNGERAKENLSCLLFNLNELGLVPFSVWIMISVNYSQQW